MKGVPQQFSTDARTHVPLTGTWQFDEAVAARFDTEARTHIPHYEHVIGMCVDIATHSLKKETAQIIDVGSATGYTLEQLHKAGFQHVLGVESSPAMIRHSRMRDRVVCSDTLPEAQTPYDLVLANWTLHFVGERASYIRDIHEYLSDGGILILTDKMTSSPHVYEQYHDFKRMQGISEETIARKDAALAGVLTTFPLEWYQGTLHKAGFRDVRVIDTAYCFKTLIAFK
jgi:SAM-dependent methyltransferase